MPDKAKSIAPSVFVSHRGADADLARRLSEDLRDAGCEVWLDEWQIGIGDSIIHRINEGLENAKYMVLCYSEDSVLSPWVSREWMSTLAKQLEGYGVKVLPVRLSGGLPPAILADVRFADFVKDWPGALRELLRAMGVS